MRFLKKPTPEVLKIAQRLSENPAIYKIDPHNGSVRVNTQNPAAAREIGQAAKQFFAALHAK
jgi:hypothetical protein